MEEKIFFDEGNVRVTSARFIVDNQTYAMNGVTSVKSHVTEPNRTTALLFIGLGILMLVFGEGLTKVIGIAIAAASVWFWTKQKGTFAVVLNSASGEAQALTSNDETYIRNVISALNDALIHRG